MQGKVTFGGRNSEEAGGDEASDPEPRRTGTTKSSKRRGTANDDDDPNKAGRMLKTEEIRQICDLHQLSRQQVYDIRSRFAGMCLMSAEDEEKELAEQKMAEAWTAKGDGSAGQGLGGNAKANGGEARGGGMRSAMKAAEGIGLSFFKKNCAFLAGCLPEIVERILVAHGLDIESPNATITWKTYLELYCIFDEHGKMEKTTLIRFWRKFFDQGGRGYVPKDEYLDVLEQLVRGSTLRKSSATTRLFAEMFQKMMANAGCLGDADEIKSDQLVAAFEREAIDIQLLCSALGS